MNTEQFVYMAKRLGYASTAFARRFAEKSGKETFDTSDLEDVFHAFEREKEVTTASQERYYRDYLRFNPRDEE